MNPFARKSVKNIREEPRRVIGRERLHGKDKEQRRREIFERSGGRCEVIKADGKRCENPITWWSDGRGGRESMKFKEQAEILAEMLDMKSS